MKRYGQFCPVAKAAELFCEKWTALIVRDLAVGATRFSELRRGVPLMSPTLLSRRLKQLEAEGVIERRRKTQGRGYTYHLTRAGLEFAPLVEALGVWGQRWSRRELAEHEIDLGLLLWSIERSADASAFQREQTVISLRLSDQPAGKDQWWFVNRDNTCELCLEDQGFDVDLYLTTTLPDMIYIIRGDLALTRALNDGRLEVHGTTAMKRKLRPWLNLSPLAKVRSMVA
jgi:DNA-binding HxlR family transcriptional regulator